MNSQYQVFRVLPVWKRAVSFISAIRETAIQTYVEELKTHVEQLTQKHTDFHESINNKNINVAYDERNGVLNATDILVDQMMYSVPATQI